MLVAASKRPLSPSAEALLKLPLDACRWPLDGPRWWCGKPATCGSYCTEHDRDGDYVLAKHEFNVESR
jgi:hypothetical protein